MESLIILHGLFLLSCVKAENSCKILVAETKPHVYQVGVSPELPGLPADKGMKIVFDNAASGNLNALEDRYLPERHLVLDGSRLKADENEARSIITLPTPPQQIWGLNRVKPFRTDILNGSNSDILRSNMIPRLMVSETVVLSFGNRGHLRLIDSNGVEYKSTEKGGYAVLCFYSIPKVPTSHEHTMKFNEMLAPRNAAHPKPQLKLTGLVAPWDVDEGGFPSNKFPADVIRIPGTWTINLLRNERNEKSRKGTVHMLTGDMTGCGAAILSDY